LVLCSTWQWKDAISGSSGARNELVACSTNFRRICSSFWEEAAAEEIKFGLEQ